MAAGDNIKGITIQIGGDVSDLNKALEQATDKTKFLQDELKSVNDALKLDPDNVDLLKKKFDILEKTIANCEPKVEDLRKAWEKAKEDFRAGKISQTEFDRITQELHSGEKELEIYKGQLETTKKKLDNVETSAGDVAESIEEVKEKTDDGTESMEGLSLGEIAVAANMKTIITTVVELIKKLNEYIIASDETFSKMKDLSDRIEKQKKAYQESSKEMEINNTRLEVQAMMIGNLDKKLADSSITETEAKKIKQELAREVQAFNEAAGDSVLVIDEETGALAKSNKALKVYLDRIKKKAEYEISYKRLVEVLGEIREQQQIIDELVAKDNGSVFYEDLINNGKASLEVLQAEEENLMGVISGYYEADEASSIYSQSVSELSDAMALSLLAAEARGAELSKVQQEELAGWKETHKQEVDDFNEVVEKEKEIHDRRLELTRNTNNEITLSYEQSLEDRIKIMQHNQEVVANYESNLATLREIALSQADEDTKQTMLGFLTTITDYSTDSMELAQMLVDDFGKTGGEMAQEYIDTWKAADVPGEAYDSGVLILKDFKAGMKSQEKEVAEEAQNIANIVTRKLRSVKVSYTLSGSGAQNNWSFRPMAQGGIVTQPTYTLTGEAGPEAIIPLDRLGGIIESALDGSSVGGSYTMNVYPMSMSDSEQERLLDKFDRRFGDRTSRRAI